MSTSTAPPGTAAVATAARFLPRKYQLIRTMTAIAVIAIAQSVGDISPLLHYFETGTIDCGLHDVCRHRLVESQGSSTDLDLERLDAGHRLEDFGEAVDAPAARHTLDDECSLLR